MTQPARGKPEQAKAEHGARSDVNWDGGKGHEPYENQDQAAATAHSGEEVPEGDRGSASGRNLEQLDAVRQKP
ncbi:MAG TPA: hypothetical protein VKD22_07380 [Ramlibacter sp.]|nr:hypothetical protein [Ramlibacter sp.]